MLPFSGPIALCIAHTSNPHHKHVLHNKAGCCRRVCVWCCFDTQWQTLSFTSYSCSWLWWGCNLNRHLVCQHYWSYTFKLWSWIKCGLGEKGSSAHCYVCMLEGGGEREACLPPFKALSACVCLCHELAHWKSLMPSQDTMVGRKGIDWSWCRN